MIRLWPRSLAGQLMAVAALALILAQAINLALLVRGQRQQHFEATAAASAALAIDTYERMQDQALPASPRGDRVGRRRAIIRELRGPMAPHDEGAELPERPHRAGRRVILSDQPVMVAGMEDWPAMARRVTAHLSEAGMPVRAVRASVAPERQASGGEAGRPPHARRGRGVVVAMQLQDGRWLSVRNRLFVPARRVGRLLLGQTLLLFGMLLGPLLFIALRVSRPLARLRIAAADTRPAAAHEPVPESGPEDVRLMIHAFNQMRERIGAMLSEKDRMLGAIGHDLRTPLASLRVRAESVEDDRLRSGMVQSIEDMTGMLEDILALARTGQPQERAEPTDLDAMIDAIVADYAALGSDVARSDADQRQRRGDLVRPVFARTLHRAINNLVDNALAYAGSGRIALTTDADGALNISVSDDGPGIDPSRIAEMMEPFARAESSRNRNTGGSGLGLALARAAARAEGGDVRIANRQPHGLVATIILPKI